MDDYDVRSRYAYDDAYGGGTDYAKAAEFEAWLAEHDRVVAANAWDEVCKALAWLLENGPPESALAYLVANNPYRITEENN